MGRKGVIVSVAIGVVVIGLGTWATLSFLSRREHPDIVEQSARLESVLAESKRLGFPMTPEELIPPIPDAENAAVDAWPIIEQISDRKIDTTVLARAAKDTKFSIHKQRYEAAMSDLSELSVTLSKRLWQFPPQDTPFDLRFPDYSKVKNVVKLLAYHAEARAKAGDSAGALQAISNGRRLAAFVGQDPALISGLVAIACDAIMLRAVERLLDVWRSSPTKLDALAKTIRSSPLNLSLRNALQGELILALHSMRNLEAYEKMNKSGELLDAIVGAAPIDQSKLKHEGLPTNTRARAYLTRIAEQYNRAAVLLEGTDLADPAWAREFDDWASSLDVKKQPSQTLAAIGLPITSDTARAYAKQIMLERMTLALIAAVRSPGAKPKLPPDPFNPGKSVQMRREGDIVRIWSVGQDKVDNSGQESVRSSRGKDLVVIFPSAARRP